MLSLTTRCSSPRYRHHAGDRTLLVEHADLGDKVVVLTGAMQPAVMARSDASFNLGAAIAALNLLEPGVYISMSGRIFLRRRA